MADAKKTPIPSATVEGSGVALLGGVGPSDDPVLTPAALEFVARLERRFRADRTRLLRLRKERQAFLDAGGRLDFLPDTRAVREGDWKIAPAPADLQDRRVEITGPVDRKMIINALNSGAQVFMADFEDSNSPTWRNVLEGQSNLIDAVRRRIRWVAPDGGKEYRLAEKTAVLVVRPRGWHLPEKHLLVDGAPVSASLFDFGLYFFHNARELLGRGTGPYFYLPKIESHLEARLWNEVFLDAQDALGIPYGTIRATVLIETLPAAFEMDEILFELREHSGGLNCGRWDYIFSFIKKHRARPDCVLPDRGSVTMEQPFLRAYSLLLIRTCHRRGAPAMGGMAAQIPIKGDPERNRVAFEKVRADKRREARDGHDGTWVAHPGLVETARAEFEAASAGPNQIDRLREDVAVGASDLLAVPGGRITEAGLRQNLDVGVRYLEAWLRGTGCVPLYDLMEDAATAEISRAQVWQWVRHGARLEDGRGIDAELVRRTLDEQMDRARGDLGSARFESGRFAPARALFERLVLSTELEEFLTLPAYDLLLGFEGMGKETP
ncbi:MAG TPA: malate synthase A [Planctomycetota bacterium]|jgi:malate synthase|nr:malate synthase A [Planctomycetota bacterium]